MLFIGMLPLENINIAPPQLGITIRPYQFFGAITILAIVIRLLTKKLFFKLIKPHWYDWLVAFFVAAGFLSIITAPDKIASFKLAIIIGTFAAFYYLVRNYIQNIEDLKRVIPFFLSSSVIVVLYGIWQNWRFLHNLSHFEVMAGRPNSTFSEADWLGMYLVLLTGIIYILIYHFYVIASEAKQSRNDMTGELKNEIATVATLPRNDIFLYVFLILTFILLILTVSRSAWLGALVSYVVFVLIFFIGSKDNHWKWRETSRLKLKIISSLIIAIGIVCVFHLTNFQLFNRVESTGTGLQKITISCEQNVDLPKSVQNVSELEKYDCQKINLEDIGANQAQGKYVTEISRNDPNVQTRSMIYQKSWNEIKNHPILGIGWGNIGSVLGRDERGTPLNSSNIFLETWLGAGILGFLTLIILLGYILLKSIRNYFHAEDIMQKIINLFVIVSWFAIMIPNLFNAGIFLGIFWVWLGVTFIKE